ncbi:MAG: FeoB-associated Cys-rich membrane protein [Elusimicrobiota bacterium]|nr:FeoB-associated Cys-rich membrane protein [Elusimicrobiota bacterium]
MIQNIIIGIIVVACVVLLIRHFKKGKCSCCKGCEKKK